MGGRNTVRPRAIAKAAQLLQSRPVRRAGVRAEPIPGLDALDTYLIATHSELAARAQAHELGVDYSLLHLWRKSLYQRGLIRRADQPNFTAIQPDEIAAMSRLYRAGYSAARIAEMRGVSPQRVYRALSQHAGLTKDSRGILIRMHELCALLGISMKAVRAMIARGWLPDSRVGIATAGGAYGWTRADVIDLLRNRDAWVAVRPGAIRDAELAAFLRAQQAEAGGRWWTRQEVAALIGVAPSTAADWTAEGLFTGLSTTIWALTWFAWLTDSQSEALEDAAAPLRAASGPLGRGLSRRTLPAIRAALGARPQATAAD